MMELICLVGLSASGKSTVARYLAGEHGYTPVSFGDTVRRMRSEIKEKLGYQYKLNDLIVSVQQAYPGGIARFTADLLRQSGADRAVMDSLVSTRDLVAITAASATLRLLGVTAPFADRVRRFQAREGYETLQAATTAIERVDLHERCLGAGPLLLACDHVIHNNRNVGHLVAEVDTFLAAPPPWEPDRVLRLVEGSEPDMDSVAVNVEPFERYRQRYLCG